MSLRCQTEKVKILTELYREEQNNAADLQRKLDTASLSAPVPAPATSEPTVAAPASSDAAGGDSEFSKYFAEDTAAPSSSDAGKPAGSMADEWGLNADNDAAGQAPTTEEQIAGGAADDSEGKRKEWEVSEASFWVWIVWLLNRGPSIVFVRL